MTDRQASVPGSQLPVPGSIPDSRFPIPDGWARGAGYAHAVSTEGRTVFLSGQIGWDPVTLKVVPGGLVAQARQAFQNIMTLLASADAGAEHLVRLTWFITDRDAYLRDRASIGAAYREVIGRHFPAMSVVVVAALLEAGAEVEIEATAVVPNVSRSSNSTGA